MMKDSSGQISLEYLLIFTISMIVLVAFTLPMMQYGIEETLDVSDTLQVKSDLSKLSSAITQVYGQGQGAKQTVDLDVKKPITFEIRNNGISAKLKLNDKSKKKVSINCKSNFKSQSFKLDKGINRIVVEWPVGEDKMIIYR